MDGGVSLGRKRKQTRLTNVRPGKKKTHLPDRLSELPEALLIKILSMLEMRDAVKTGTLSTRWKLLWTQVDSIVFRGSDFVGGTQEQRDRIYQQVISFVDQTLMQCTSPSIKMFELRNFGCNPRMRKATHDMFDKWIACIMQKNVESVNLCLVCMNYSAPHCLYRNSSLVNLKLREVNLSVTSPVSWPSLRSLDFVGMWIDDDSFANILLGCPVLETIVLDGCWGIMNIKITSPSVKKLKLAKRGLFDGEILKVTAPWLQELQIGEGDFPFVIPQLQLVDVSSLIRASLWFGHNSSDKDLRWNEVFEGLFKSLCHVAELTISTEVVQAFALPRLLGKPCPLFMCKHMTVHVPLWKYDLYGIVCLLQNAPYLETLLITVVGQYYDEKMSYLKVPDPKKELFDSKDQEMSLPEGNLMHLKYVKIDYESNWKHSVGDGDGKECMDFELLEYILRSTSVLEKLVIMSSLGTHCEICFTTCSSRYVRRLSSKLLLMYLVGNETLEWELVKTNASFDFRFSNYTPLLPIK